MNLTRRGGAVIVLVAGAIYMSFEYGPRALNAIVAPAVIALVAGLVQVWWADVSTVERTVPPADVVGTEDVVELSIDTDSSIGARIHDTVEPGLDADGNTQTVTLGEDTITYRIRLRDRGEHELGPLTVVVSDVLGLVRQRYRFDKTDRMLVYPRIHAIDAREFSPGLPIVDGYGRDEFEHLREYHHGDSLRTIDWKSTAKRTDEGLLVSEYRASEKRRSVRVAVETDEDSADTAAAAAASVLVYLLDADFDVGLVVPDGEIRPGSGPDHRRSALETLARLSAGSVLDDARDSADISLAGTDAGVTIRTANGTMTFEEVVQMRAGEPIPHENPLGGTRPSGPATGTTSTGTGVAP